MEQSTLYFHILKGDIFLYYSKKRTSLLYVQQI